VRVWDTSRRVARFQASADGLSDVTFSPDGQVLAVADADGSARLWNVHSGDLLHRLDASAPLKGSAPLMNDLAFANDRELVTASEKGILILWDVKAEKPIRVLSHAGPSIESVAVAGQERVAVTANDQGEVRLWNLDTGKYRVLQHGGGFSTAGVAIDSTGHWIAMFKPDQGVVIVDVQKGPLERLKLDGPSAEALSFSPDGRRLAVATDDFYSLVFDLGSKRVIARLYDAVEPTNVAYSPDGRFLATTSWDSARIWDVATGKQLVRLPGGEPDAAAFAPDSRRLAVVGAEGGEVLVYPCPFCGSPQDLKDAARKTVDRIKLNQSPSP
jgi:WD40 repeat protein